MAYKNPLEQSKELLKNDPWTPEKEKWSDAYYHEVKDAIQEDEKGQPKGRDWGYDRLPKDWDDYSTDARLSFYESKFPNDDNPKLKQAILDEYKERINAIKKESEERSNKWNAFKQATQYPQGVFRKDLDDWDKLHKEYSDILGEDAAYDLLYKIFGK